MPRVAVPEGHDTLFGSYGPDHLYGEAGADTFIVRRGDFDIIEDCNLAQGDQIKVWLVNLDGTPSPGSSTLAYDNNLGVLSSMATRWRN